MPETSPQCFGQHLQWEPIQNSRVCVLSSDFFVHSRPVLDNSPVPARTTATIDINLIRMFSDGPEVSLNGSPIVSPITAAS